MSINVVDRQTGGACAAKMQCGLGHEAAAPSLFVSSRAGD